LDLETLGRRIAPHPAAIPDIAVEWRRCVFMTSSALSSWLAQDETTDPGDAARIELLSPSCACPP